MALILKATGGGCVAPACDPAEVRRAAAVLFSPPGFVQVQALPSGVLTIAPAADVSAVVRFAEEWSKDSRTEGVYWSLNPGGAKGSGEGGGYTVGDITRRTRFLVDLDRHKGKQDKKLSATDGEKAGVRAMAGDVVTYLVGGGWPMPVEIDSGNGHHLIYWVDLANDDEGRVILRECLKTLANVFAGDARGQIDTKTHNANRISKLPGTWARKGPSTPDRPHRPCVLTSVPSDWRPVPLELLKELAGHPLPTPTPPVVPPAGTNGHHASPLVLRASGEQGDPVARCRAYLAKIPPAVSEQKGHTATFIVAQVIARGFLLPYEDGYPLLREFSDRCLPPWSEKELQHKWDSAVNTGEMALGRLLNWNVGDPILPDAAFRGKKAEPEVDPDETIIVRASEITPTKVQWLWPNRIPRGKLTTFAGQTGQGKTFVSCDIMTRVTLGKEWADGTPNDHGPGQVLFITGDDEFDDTIVPRVMNAGAVRERVVFLTEAAQAAWTMAALKTLDVAIAQACREERFGAVQLVVVDPPTSFMGGVDDHKNTELRSVLTPFKTWAKRNNVAVIFISHVNKGGAGQVEAMMRVMGGIAWVTGVRTAYMFAPDPDDEARQLFLTLKNNLGPKAKGLAYRITGPIDAGKIEWLGEVDTTADQAMRKEGGKPRRVLATKWMVDLFLEKLEWSSDEFWASAKMHGVSKNAIDEARVSLGLPRPRRITTIDGGISWTWWVPPDWPPLVKAQQSQGQPPPSEEGF